MKPTRSTKFRPAKGVPRARRAGKHLIVLGCGGNIGSFLVSLLARLAGVVRLTLVDCDQYEHKNLQSQEITPADVGQPKAKVQARRALRINPRLDVVALVGRFEHLPLNWLRGDIILACLDSKESRRLANEIAWRLGVPWVDAGVEPSQMLARVNVYWPGLDQPCLECAWGQSDYAEQATLHPCDAGAAQPPPSNSPACLGALAASLSAIECQKLLNGKSADALIGRQVIIEAVTHKQFVTSFRRNPNCRFNHATWKISRLRQSPRDLRIGEALQRLGAKSDATAALVFGGTPVVKQLDCPGCGFSRRVFCLQSRLRKADRYCPKCGSAMMSAGFFQKPKLSGADLGPGDADRSLASLGLQPGDVISVRSGADEKYYELGSGTGPQAKSTSTQWRKNYER